MDDEIGAERERLLEERRGERVVDDEQRSRGMRRGGNGPAVGGREAATELRGMSLSSPSDELAQKFGLTAEQRKGAVVTDVKPRSAAAKAGLRPGDVITEVAGKPVASAKEAADAIAKQEKGKILLLYVTTNTAGGSRFVFVEPQK